MSTAPPGNRPTPPPEPVHPAPPASIVAEEARHRIPAPAAPVVEGRLRTLGTTSLFVGIVAALLTLVTPFRDPNATAGLTVVAVLALVLGLVVWVRAARVGLRATSAFVGVLLSVVSLALLAISFIPYLFMFLLAEPVGADEPAVPPAVVRPVDDELRDLEASARMAAQMLDVVRQRADGTYPAELVLTAGGDRLSTPAGVVITGLPDGTDVSYQTFAGGTRYVLTLFGAYGGTAVADSEVGLVSSSAGSSE